MENLTPFPDHQIIQSILTEDTNITYTEWKEKVDKLIQPIYATIDKLIHDHVPSFPKATTSYKPKKSSNKRLFLSRLRWIYNNPNLSFSKKIHIFVQLGDYRTGRQKTIFWGVSYWVGGVSDEIDSVFRLFEKFSNIQVFKESGGVGGYSNSGTTVFGIVDQYTIAQLPNLPRDIKPEIAEGIGNLFQEMEQIAGGTASDNGFEPAEHLPTKADVEFAESQLRKSYDGVIGMKDVLDQIEVNFSRTKKELKEDWQEITRRNIETWFGRRK